jgi:hypothetical protein
MTQNPDASAARALGDLVDAALVTGGGSVCRGPCPFGRPDTPTSRSRREFRHRGWQREWHPCRPEWRPATALRDECVGKVSDEACWDGACRSCRGRHGWYMVRPKGFESLTLRSVCSGSVVHTSGERVSSSPKDVVERAVTVSGEGTLQLLGIPVDIAGARPQASGTLCATARSVTTPHRSSGP